MESILTKAESKEKEYAWSDATVLYEQALGLIGKTDFMRKGEIRERIAYCLHQSSFQLKTQEEFANRMREAIGAYEKAAEVYGKVEPAKNLYCQAMASYNNSWIHVEASQKKESLGECEKLLKKAMKAFQRAEDPLSYGRACNDLSFCLLDQNEMEWDWSEIRRRFEEAVKHGQSAVSTLSKVGDQRELTRAYTILGINSHGATVVFFSEEAAERFAQTSINSAEKAFELSKKIEDAYLIAWSNLIASKNQIDFAGNLELSLKHAERCLQQATESKDSYLIGRALSELAYVTHWMTGGEENPDKYKEGFERIRQYTEDALRHFLVVHRYGHDTVTLPNVYPWYLESYNALSDVETDLEERRNLLGKAIEIGREGLKDAEQEGGPGIWSVLHGLSKALYRLSRLETQNTEKRQLLEEASEYRQRNIDVQERIQPSFNWNRGVSQNHAALIKAELATIKVDEDKKRELLEEAVSHMERCIEYIVGTERWEKGKPGKIAKKNCAAIGWYSNDFGNILNQLYSLTKKEEVLEKAVRVYENTAEWFRNGELPSRAAEAYWHAAKLYDQLGEHKESERSFQQASEEYKQVAEKITQLREFYLDHALYMQAWSEIQKAKVSHAEKQYGLASEHYEKAADLHKSTKRWSYLSPNYLALTRLEAAEDLSRSEQAEEARELFQQAAELITEAKEAINTQQAETNTQEEIATTTDLNKASDTRHTYCLGRIALEEAKILDRQGNHTASSAKYAVATESFQKAIDSTEDELDLRELKPIVNLTRAWQKMKQAEAEAAPALYLVAAQFFDKAKELSLDEKSRVLALGHSSFCKALEAGAKFEITRDMAVYSIAKKHLEAAANHYVKAGFKNASEYAKATNRLFDAYMYMHKAETEADPMNKTQNYTIAEKLLQSSAGSYMKAKHPEKSEEVQRLLESIREERQLAKSLAEVLHAPTITSTTTSFQTPTPTQEQPVGLDKFESADIQANLIFRAKEVKVGEDIDFAIELVNAGKAPALLIKVDEVTPEGFEIRQVPDMYTFEDSFINMKGKRLNPLKTEDLKVVLTPQSTGTHTIKPRILYLDETGKYKSHEPEPVTITVKELGITGWIKGER